MNSRIRVRGQLLSPLVGAIAAEVAEVEHDRIPHMWMVWGYKSTHRLIKVDPQDWGLQACSTMEPSEKEPPPDVVIYLTP